MTVGLLGAGSFNGLSWGPGTNYHIGDITGLEDLPEVRTSDVLRPIADGAWAGIDRLGIRHIEMDLHVIADTPTNLYAQLATAEAALIRTTDEHDLLVYGSSTLVRARVRRRVVDYFADRQQRTATIHLAFEATDPRKYSATLHQQSTGLGTATGGLVFPATFPATFGSGSAGGQVSVTNLGNTDTPPTMTIVGPVDNPIIDHVELGRSLQFTLSLITGDTLVLDADARTATLNGTANREQNLSLPQWFFLTPGTNTVKYRNNGGFTASTLTVAWRDADL